MVKDSEKKGRPTPKRKDAEASRKVASLAPATSKIEKQRAREAARANRVAVREAQMRGEESALLPRDRGPEKRYVRNFVDSRKSIAEYLMPTTFVVLILSLIPVPAIMAFGTVLMYTLLVFAIIEGVLMNRRLKKAFGVKFPATPYKGYSIYAFTRFISMRRLRVPRAQVKAGGSL
jgi:hypothetical protein